MKSVCPNSVKHNAQHGSRICETIVRGVFSAVLLTSILASCGNHKCQRDTTSISRDSLFISELIDTIGKMCSSPVQIYVHEKAYKVGDDREVNDFIVRDTLLTESQKQTLLVQIHSASEYTIDSTWLGGYRILTEEKYLKIIEQIKIADLNEIKTQQYPPDIFSRELGAGYRIIALSKPFWMNEGSVGCICIQVQTQGSFAEFICFLCRSGNGWVLSRSVSVRGLMS